MLPRRVSDRCRLAARVLIPAGLALLLVGDWTPLVAAAGDSTTVMVAALFAVYLLFRFTARRPRRPAWAEVRTGRDLARYVTAGVLLLAAAAAATGLAALLGWTGQPAGLLLVAATVGGWWVTARWWGRALTRLIPTLGRP